MSTSWWQEYFTDSRIHIWVIMLITFLPQHPAWHILPWQNIANKVDAFSSILVWFLCVLSLKLMVPSAIESTLSWQSRPTAMPFIAYITTNHKEVLHNWQPYVIFWELCCSLLHGILLSFFWFGRTLWLKAIWGGKSVIQFASLQHSPLSKRVRAITQGRNLGAGTEVEAME